MTTSFARRVAEIEPFLAVEVGERAGALERQGVDVVHLEFGEPDFEAPLVVRPYLARLTRSELFMVMVCGPEPKSVVKEKVAAVLAA